MNCCAPSKQIASMSPVRDLGGSEWTNPDFDGSQPAFYYGRVIEISTPRWTAYDAKRFGTQPLRVRIAVPRDDASDHRLTKPLSQASISSDRKPGHGD